MNEMKVQTCRGWNFQSFSNHFPIIKGKKFKKNVFAGSHALSAQPV